MRSPAKKLSRLLFTLSLFAMVFNTGCAVRGRVYDSYDHQYRSWAPENGNYTRWEQQNHRTHEDYKKRSDQDKNAYWKWRHDQNHDQQ